MGIVTNRHKPAQLISRDDLSAFGVLLKPSWLSGLLAVVVSVAIVAGAVTLLHYNGSSWQQLITEQRQQTSEVSANSTTFENEVTSNVLVSSLPLLVFWAGIGIIVYSFLIAIMDVFRNALELKEEMHYVHANRRVLLQQAVFHLFLRGIFLATWVAYANFTLHAILPYVIAMSYAGSGGLGWLYNSTYLVGAVIIGTACLHLHTILLRLLLLKPRMFGQTAEA